MSEPLPPGELPPPEPSETCQLTDSLADVPAARLDADRTSAFEPISSSPGGTIGEQAGRFRLLSEIGHGGMGAVLKARDPDLDREVAVKVLLETQSGNSELHRRFLEEARITGRLQHPGVVPVYELGRFTDQRPFFAMKLVQGQTLSNLLRQRPDSKHDRPRFLKIFEQVCQALAYAHSRGVIHRDLKPTNIMVGAFGEVQVMDWGLAKAISADGARLPNSAADLGTEPSDADTELHQTKAGKVMGTPGYMAPEQARGETDQLDERADVFGLGAILCEVLTGEPPYSVRGTKRLLQWAETGELSAAFARLDDCGADAELAELAKRCLAAHKEDRPAHAGAVAEAASGYLQSVEQRLRRAETERAAAQVKAREERKRRKVQFALAASVLLLVLVGAGVGWSWQRQRTERRQAVEAGLVKVAELQDRGRWAEARTVLDAAKARLGTSPGDLARRLQQAERNLDLVARLDGIRLNKATIVEDGFDNAGADAAYEVAFDELGFGNLSESPATVAERIRTSSMQPVLVAALEDWAVSTQKKSRRDWLLEVARLADPDPNGWRERFHDPAAWNNPQVLADLAKEATQQLTGPSPPNLSPQLLLALGVRLFVRADDVSILRLAQARYPADFWLGVEMSNALTTMKQWDEAVAFARVAQALRPDTALVHNNLGYALHELGRLDDAVAAYRQAVALGPLIATTHNSLGFGLMDQGHLDEAAAELRRAIELDPKFARSYSNLGNVHFLQGHFDEAVAACRQAIELEPDFAKAHNNLGTALDGKGLYDEAIAEYRRAIALDGHYAWAHYNLGLTLRKKGLVDAAMGEYRRANFLDPKLAKAHNNLGIIYHEKGMKNEAKAEYRQAIACDPKMVAAHNNLGSLLLEEGKPDEAMTEFRQSLKHEPNSAASHSYLGQALQAKKQYDQAITEFRTAVRLDPQSVTDHTKFGNLLDEMGCLDEAVVEFRRAIEIDPNFADAHYNLGLTFVKKKCFNEAAAEYRKTIEVDPNYAEAYCNLGEALRNLGEFETALAALKHGHELGIRHKDWNYASDKWIKECERLLKGEKQVSAVLLGLVKPANAQEWIDYIQICRFKKLYAGAVQLSTSAFALHPNLLSDLTAQHRYNAACSAVLAAAGKGKTTLDGREKARVQKQALDWLRADLSLYARYVNEKPSYRELVGQRLQSWQQDPELASAREAQALRELTLTEREAWEKLWTDVGVLYQRTQTGKK
jgi:tetratricopeptide (TPR) repeat protein